MAKWKKNEKLGLALGREAGSIAKGEGKELLSIAPALRPGKFESTTFRKILLVPRRYEKQLRYARRPLTGARPKFHGENILNLNHISASANS